MIHFPPKIRVTGKTLTGYLLGALRQNQTERLDELSIVDGDFAARLNALENDLVDAYVQGKLIGDTLQKVRARYLSSEKRREKVSFAEALYLFEGERLTRAAPIVGFTPMQESRSLFVPGSWRLFAFPRWLPAGALAMLLAIILLFINSLHIGNRMSQAKADREDLQQRKRDPQATLDQVHAPDAEVTTDVAQVQKPLAGNSATMSSFSPLGIVAFALSPQLRGAAQMPELSLPPGTTQVDLHLDLESNDCPQYQVALKSLGKDQILWHSGKLKAETKGQRSAVLVSMPAALLKPETYQLELTGSPSSRDREFVSNYVFRIGSS